MTGAQSDRRRAVPDLTGYSITSEVAGREESLLELEGLASLAANAFVFDDDERSLAVRRLLLLCGAAEFAAPSTTLLLDPVGTPVGMYAVCSAGDLSSRRLAGAVAVARRGRGLVRPDEVRRMQRLAAAQAPVVDGDVYLARIAVASSAAGTGVGRWLLSHMFDAARDAGFTRCVLDVADENTHAGAFYARAGFTEFGTGVAHDEDTGRSCTLRHLAYTF